MSEMITAITGTIGSGKSTVADYIRGLGYFVFDCDAYNRYLLEKDNEGYLRVKDHFPEVFDGEILNKGRLADIIFKDPVRKKELEDILHPLIMKKCFLECSRHEVSFAEVPLLFEGGYEKNFDHSILVVCDRETAIERLKLRGLSEMEALARLESQMSLELKISRADKIVYNNCGLKDLYRSIDIVLKELC